MNQNILIIEDEPDIARLVEIHLEDLGCHATLAASGEAGIAELNQGDFDLVVLDLMLPGIDGLEVCQRIRSGKTYTPILMLTAKSSEFDRVLGLESGADDYLTKPFSVREFVARVKAILRRVDALRSEVDNNSSGPLTIEGLSVDSARRTVEVEDQPIHLTAKEFDLLHHFASHPGRVFTRTQLLDLVWGYGHDGYEHTVNSHINRLRAKIESDPASPRYILTVWGVGYKFCEPETIREALAHSAPERPSAANPERQTGRPHRLNGS